MIVYTAFTFPTSHYFVHLSQGRDLYAFSYGGHGFNANLLYMILCLFGQVKNLKDIQVFTSLPYLILHLHLKEV